MDEMNQTRNNRKKLLLTLIPVLVLVIAVVGVTYAFFNYTRAGADNSIGTGRINFVSTQSGTTSISNYFPQIPGGAQADQSSTATITVTGGTTFTGGIKYYVKLIDVKVGNDAYDPETDVPVYVDVAEVSGLTVANRGTFTPEGTNHSGVGIALSEGVVIANGTIGVADAAANSDNWINGTFTVQAYIPSNVAISDTTGEYSTTEYVNGTTTTWVAGRRVLTTEQWNALSTNPVTFKIQVVANEGIPPVVINYNAGSGTIATASKTIAGDSTTYGALAEPTPDTGYLFAGWYTQAEGGTPVTSTTSFTNGTSATTLYAHYAQESLIKCKRVTNASNLHTETCEQSSNCRSDGYTGSNTTITYGNAKELGSELAVGDAFDCKVSTSGGYTERFYYVSPYFDTQTETFDSLDNIGSYVALIYYSNIKNINGTITASDGKVAYNSSGKSYEGPVTAANHLQTIDAWNNAELKTTSRNIWACTDRDCSSMVSSFYSFAISNPFNYNGKASRLLTLNELKHAGCEILSGKTSLDNSGSLNACNFLREETRYANYSNNTNYGFWLETIKNDPINAFYVRADTGNVDVASVSLDSGYGVRPTIDVPVTALLK